MPFIIKSVNSLYELAHYDPPKKLSESIKQQSDERKAMVGELVNKDND